MTIEKIVINEDRWKVAFSSKEREYLECLAKRINLLNEKILAKTNTPEEKLEYHSLKWCLKQIGGVAKDELERTPRPKILKRAKNAPTNNAGNGS